jgi:PAS domain S-box-containing protein
MSNAPAPRSPAERALVESERYFRALTEQSTDVVVLLDVETRMLYASPSMERVLGYSSDEILGHRAFELVHPDDLEAVLTTIMDGITIPGAVRRLEYRFRHKDGSWRFLEGVGRNLLDDPTIGAIVVNARDVTDRKLAEAVLRDRERQLAAAQAIAHVGSWEWDLTTNVVTWSDELRRMYGLPLDAPAGYAEFLAIVHPDDRQRLQDLVAEGVRTLRPIDYEWRVVRPSGEVRHIQARNVVIPNEAGQASRMAGTSFDITERKQAEESQRTLLRELTAAVTEVKTLKGILPICASCKRIRREDGGWEQVESYVREHTNAEFSHGLCADCAARDWGSLPGTPRT